MSSFSPDKDKVKKSILLGGTPTWKPFEFLTNELQKKVDNFGKPPKVVGLNDKAVQEARVKALRNAIRNSTRNRTMLTDYGSAGQSATAERKPALGS